MQSVEEILRQRLEKTFNPTFLKIVNESFLHEGHLPESQSSGQTHFKVEMQTTVFQNLSKIERHRRVYQVLDDLFQSNRLHALCLFV